MMISRELPPCRLRVCRDFIPPAFLDHDLMVRLWVLCPCAQFRERHHFGWADGSSAIHLLQCIALAVSTRPIQWRAQLGKNPRDGRRLLFTGYLVGTPAVEAASFRSASVFLVRFANSQWACMERAVSPGDLQEDIDVDCFQIFLRHLHLNARPDHAVIVDRKPRRLA